MTKFQEFFWNFAILFFLLEGFLGFGMMLRMVPFPFNCTLVCFWLAYYYGVASLVGDKE